jgi:hypothetical protein
MAPMMMVSIGVSEFSAEPGVKPVHNEEAHDNRNEDQVIHKTCCNVRKRFNRLARETGHTPFAACTTILVVA